jgi:1-pyrroline-5-carboxylate dehydrogenase
VRRDEVSVMNNSIFSIAPPANEPVLAFGPGSSERAAIVSELAAMTAESIEIPLIVGGREVRTGTLVNALNPSDGTVLARYHQATEADVTAAIAASVEARKQWESLPWVERAAVNARIAELISRKYRYRLLAATMLGQGKNVYQAEIDAACEVIDFLRFNAHFASSIYTGQPGSTRDQVNRMEYRPLEGFVLAVSPFNFTAIASNLNMSPVVMGNVTLWKPASTAVLSGYVLMQIYQEAGVPPGVINFLPGSGAMIGRAATAHREFAGVHFTGSNGTFNSLWRTIAGNLEHYRSYPRIVGETGGKDFVFVHPSGDSLDAATALVRGAFEYQGQKCSAASRAYIPRSLWPSIKTTMLDMLGTISVGDVRDLRNFVNPVIDEAAFDSIMGYIAKAQASPDAEIIAGGTGDKRAGFYIQPTIVLTTDPRFVTMEEEIFGPVLTVFVYEDADWKATLELCDTTSPYALTGAVFARDRYAIDEASRALRYAAGNFYVNDKPTGAVVGLQPFGGARGSGTNDKAGGPLNLLRWVSPRAIKETYLPATDYRYPFLAE